MYDDKRIAIGAVGAFLLLIGLLLPTYTTDWTSWLYENIEWSLQSNDSGRLMITALSYISWYLMTFLFIYLGGMVLANIVARDRSSILYQVLFVLIILGSVYVFNELYNEHYSYLIHLLVLGILLFLQNFIPQQKYFYIMYIVILAFILFSVQWLNLIPGMTKFGFGSDDFAVSIKLADEYLTDHILFNTLSTILFGVFFVIAIIVTTILHLYSKQVMISKQFQVQTQELKETRGALIETNVYKEIHSLVHDLKTPLVTVEGLLSLLAMKIQDTKSQAYFHKINGSIEKMKDMVSEILYEETKREIHVQELMNYVVSHISLDDPSIDIKVKVEDDLPMVRVNKIRMSRAISNVVENAILSLQDEGGEVSVCCQESDEGVLITVKDDGMGIDPAYLEDIWEEGFSTKDSSGIGLPFVKNVIHQHGGTVQIESEPQVYTRVDMFIPFQSKEDNEDDSRH